MDLFEELAWRGMLQDCTPELKERLQRGPIVAYIGFDPTARSLHIGNLATVMLLVHLQRAGHKPIALVGGATGMVGDPSGKKDERKLLDEESLKMNQAGIRAQLERFLDFSPGPAQAQIANNYDWFGPMGFLQFLREVGKHLTVNYMMAKDSVQNRMETGISFTEFSYQLLQAYDFYYLHQHYGCELQMGGSDQWGNITSGIELVRRMSGATVHGLTAPLLTKSDGSKYGKSEQGNIWLDPSLTSPFRFYQFLVNSADDDIERLHRVFSLADKANQDELLAQHRVKPHLRLAQKALAQELTLRIHGQEGLTQALNATEVLFGGGDVALQALRTLDEAQILDIFEGVPQGQLPRIRLLENPTAADVLFESGMLPTKGEAKREIMGGGIRINQTKTTDPQQLISTADLLADQFLLLQKGKKNYYLVRMV